MSSDADYDRVIKGLIIGLREVLEYEPNLTDEESDEVQS